MKKILLALSLLFLCSPSWAVVTAYMIKDSTLKDIGGNVGIGTTEASEKLFVNGNIKNNGTIFSNLMIIGGAPVGDWDVSDGLVGYYKLDDNAASTVVTDQTGNNNGVSNTNTSNLTTTGKLGQGFVFTTSRKVTITNNALHNFTGDFSIEAWIKNANLSDVIMGSRLDTGINRGWQMSVGASVKQVAFSIDTGSTNPAVLTTSALDTNWHHIVAIRRSGSGEIWFDGVLEAGPTTGFAYNMTISNGDLLFGGTPRNPQEYTGSLDNIRIYNRALSTTEIAGLYKLGVGTELNNNDVTYQFVGTSNLGTSHLLSTSKDSYIEGKLEVDGTIYADGGIVGDGSLLTGVTASVGWADDGANVRLTTVGDNVGIGTTTPAGKLDIWGNGTTTGVNTKWRDSAGTAKVTILDNGNVGFGTTVPPNKIYVAGTGEFTGFKLNGNGVAAGYVLTSGTTGIGTWMPAAAGGGGGGTECSSSSCNLNVATTLNSQNICLADGTNCIAAGSGWTDGGTNVFTTTTTDVVGIGTTTIPAATTLNIVKQTGNYPLRVSSAAGGNGDYLVITSAGAVGIGTVNPGSSGLAIGSTSNTLFTSAGIAKLNNVSVTFDDQTVDTNKAGQTQYGNTNSGSGAATLFYGGSAANSQVIIKSTDHSTPTTDKISFQVGVSGTNAVVMSIIDGGNVGIGTALPRGLLDVGVGSKFTVLSGGNVGIGSISPGTALDVQGDIRNSTTSGQADGTIVCMKNGRIGYCTGAVVGILCTCN